MIVIMIYNINFIIYWNKCNKFERYYNFNVSIIKIIISMKKVNIWFLWLTNNLKIIKYFYINYENIIYLTY